MKILYLVSNPQLNPSLNTGYGRHIRETVKGLKLRGHEVEVLLSGSFIGERVESTNIPSIKKWSNFKYFLPSLIWETLKDIRQLKADREYIKRVKVAIARFQPEVVYERMGYLSKPIELKRIFHTPWLLEVNAPIVDERIEFSGNSLLSFCARNYERKVLQNASHIFCVSNALADYIGSKHNIGENKISVNHNGVDPIDFELKEVSRVEGLFVVGFIGSILPYHGIDKLIKAFSAFHTLVPNSELRIVGDGETIVQLEELVDSLGLTAHVKFTGSMPFKEVKNQIAVMDVCVLPSTNWYCSPVKLFEYGIMKKPIISLRTKPVMEVIENEVDGLLIDNNVDLVNALKMIYSNPIQAANIAQSFRNKVVKNYTWECNVLRIDQVLQSLEPNTENKMCK